MSWVETLGELGDRRGAALAALAAALEEWGVSEPTWLALATALVLQGRSEAAALADLALAAELSVVRGKAVPTLGLTPDANPRAVHEGLSGLLAKVRAEQADLADALRVEGRDDALKTAQETHARGMRRRGVRRWERVLNATACELCRSLAAEGPMPASATPYHHRGCGCAARPITEGTQA